MKTIMSKLTRISYKRMLSILIAVLLVAGSGTLVSQVQETLAGPTGTSRTITGTKTAQVNGNLKNPGTEIVPVAVSADDTITYEITADKPENAEPDKKYDVLFMLDWSGSMDSAMTGFPETPVGAKDPGGALGYSKRLVMEMSDFVMENYPDSRIAVLGHNSSGNNLGNPSELNLQYDTPFVGEDEYEDVIKKSFSIEPALGDDDNPTALRAAVEKMEGDESKLTTFGIDNWWVDDNVKEVIVRDELEKGRIPVIVMISDFQIQTDAEWKDRLKPLAQRFAAIDDDAILLTIRTDHAENHRGVPQNTDYTQQKYTDLMKANLAPMGMDTWSFTIIDDKTAYDAGFDQFKGDFLYSVPIPVSFSIIDEIPVGLEVDTAQFNGGTNKGGYDPKTRTVTWDLSDPIRYEPGKSHTVSVVTKVIESSGEMTYRNQAFVKHGELKNPTNPTFHRQKDPNTGGTTPPTDGKKSASVKGGPFETGSEDERIVVATGDKITYKIEVEKPVSLKQDAKYDVLFVLDMSESMNGKMGGGGTAREHMNNIAKSMSTYIFQNYPDSRVAFIGATGYYNTANSFSAANFNDSRYVNMGLQTPFMTNAQYLAQLSSFNTALDNSVKFPVDDNAQFLAAAVNTMRSTPTTYGELAGVGNQKTTVRRDAGISDVSERIPVIMVISDFQMTEAFGTHSNQTNKAQSNSAPEPYWSASMKRQADAFDEYSRAEYGSRAFLMTVRLDHAGNLPSSGNFYSEESYNKLMRDNVVPASRGWSLVPVHNNATYAVSLDLVKKEFAGRVSKPSSYFKITDKVPEGLTVDTIKISHQGKYDEQTRTITWDLTNSTYAAGGYELTFDATVEASAGERIYDNQAVVIHSGRESLTNWTYHRKPEEPKTKTLHLRQVVLNSNESTELPYTGFFTLKNGSKTYSVTTDSNGQGTEVAFRSISVAFEGGSKVYDISPILPQYYEYVGFITTPSYAVGSHDPAQRQTGQAKADFTSNNEIWMTVYIRPKGDSGKHSWSFATNDFRSIVLD